MRHTTAVSCMCAPVCVHVQAKKSTPKVKGGVTKKKAAAKAK